MNKKYKYFVSYTFCRNGSRIGVGCSEVNRGNKIRDIEDIKEIIENIEKDELFGKVSIVNWKLFEE